jgi:hypothetical protein
VDDLNKAASFLVIAARVAQARSLDAMFRSIAILFALLASFAAMPADSVILGHGVSNAFLSLPPCPEDFICMDANYKWILDAVHTVVGPSIVGRVTAITSQHTDATAKFVTLVELFILRPIDDKSLRESSGANYYLILLSPRYPHGRYCLGQDPSGFGVKLDPSQVKVDENGYFCFPARALASNKRLERSRGASSVNPGVGR